ncbi:MAG TPA: beta-glucosidase BglX, partial [Gammaproteobacteria bacterium]|nr:beta-glucosidase BglX [Gammaproteobacteria bacterium]
MIRKSALIALLLLPFASSLHAMTVNLETERKIDQLLAKMTVEDKIGQTALRGLPSRMKGVLSDEIKQAAKEGRLGAVLNVMNPDSVRELQRIAVEESPSGIPLIFGRDVIHGFRTVFPIPLAQAASWNPELAEKGARIAAVEASSVGIRWAYSPMVDIVRDPRWGRVAESFGEDPYLSSTFAAAFVRGLQGMDLSDPTSLAACVKHFAGYGAAEGGRDYNTAYIPEELMRDIYLPPFKAAADAGAASFMTAFNDINGVPATANRFLLTRILREEWQFPGFVVSDWDSVIQMIDHGFAADARHAAERAMNAGLDMEMTSNTYEKYMAQLIREGKVSMAQLDEAVRRILRVKFALGLFEKPYPDTRNAALMLSPAHLAAARESAEQSAVLLKNAKNTLPLAKSIAKVAVIGPLADAPHEQLGTWIFDGNKENTRTPLRAIRDYLGTDKVLYQAGLAYSRSKDHRAFADALTAAKESDVVLFFGGEESILSGEAHSRADINLPGAQEELIRKLHRTGKPLVLVVLAGRPITFGNIIDETDSILYAWHPGTMGGPALARLIFGERAPEGRLPITWPKAVGQIPIYYNHKNTGRPPVPEKFVQLDDIPVEAWQSSLGNTSHYLDLGFTPQYPFGYGLGYTSFEYKDLSLSAAKIRLGDEIKVSAIVRNSGQRKGVEVVQLYVQDVVGDITRPVRELKGFQKIALKPGESKKISFTLHTDQLSFHNLDMQSVTEPGLFNVWIGPNA